MSPAVHDLDLHDFDLHGLVGVRLVDAGPAQVASVARQLGLPATRLDREPDVTVRYVDVATHEALTWVGLGDAGYNDEGFFLLGKGGRTRLPFADVGDHPELVCERGVTVVPHLLALVNLAALGKGVLPLHASAFRAGPTGVLVVGWSKGGKTEALLAAVRRGAEYVGDEWVYLCADDTMLGLPEPIRVWDWQLRQLPEVWRARTAVERGRVSAWRAIGAVAGRAATTAAPGAALAGRVAPVARRQAWLRIPPPQLFGAEKVALRGHLDAAVLVLSHDQDSITVGEAGRHEVSGRMAASLAEERAPLDTHYRQFRFAFPDRRCPALESAGEREAVLLSARFDHRTAARVVHPHPCDLEALGDAVLRAARLTSEASVPAPLAAP